MKLTKSTSSLKNEDMSYVCSVRLKLIVLFFAITLTSSVYSNPVLNNVVSGSVTVQQSPGTTIVNQTSQKAILNWMI